MFHLPEFVSDLSLLLIRIVVFVSFISSSKNKAKNLKKFAKNNGISVPVAGFLMVSEFAGALGMITGLLAQEAALGLMLVMTSTISIHTLKWKSPYWASRGGWEYDLMLFVLCSVILFHNAGSYAVKGSFLKL